MLTTGFVVVGHFAAYTFISPILQEISGVAQRHVGSLLLLYGASGILGNIVAGMFAGRHPYRAVLAIPSLLLVVVAIFPVVGVEPTSGVLLLMLWGAVFGSVSVSIQTWILRTAPNTEAATALMAFVFNMSIGLGAMGRGASGRWHQPTGGDVGCLGAVPAGDAIGMAHTLAHCGGEASLMAWQDQ